MSPPAAQLDHVVLLVPYDYLTNPPDWLHKNFTLSPGGRHADDKTENRLVLFRDGTYLELIAFISDDAGRRKGHWWDKPFGVVDFSLGTPVDKPLDHAALAARLQRSETGISYASPQPGGRQRPSDGFQLKWQVTFPVGAPRGAVPFWCEDLTAREYRVPLTKANTTHPCGALGMAGVKIQAQSAAVERLSGATAAIVDASSSSSSNAAEDHRYEIGAPVELSSLMKPTIRLGGMPGDEKGDQLLTLILQTESHEEKERIREEIGEEGLVLIDFE